MKHLNANLDNITNVELKATPVGGIRPIGIDTAGDVVEAQATSDSGDGSVDVLYSDRVLIGNNVDTGYYFDADVAGQDLDGDCWRIGSIANLTIQGTDAAIFNIQGTIQKIEITTDEASGGMGGGEIISRRVFVNNLMSLGSTNAFPEVTPATDPVTFEVYTLDDAETYCVLPDGCVLPNTLGNDARFGNIVGTDRLRGTTIGTISSFIASRGISAPANSEGPFFNVPRGDTYGAIYSGAVCWSRNFFWGYDTEEDGTPIVHPDTGIPSIVVCESSRAGNTPPAPYQVPATPTPSNVITRDTSPTINYVPDPGFDAGDGLTPLTRTNVDGESLMIQNGSNFSVRGGTPYFNSNFLASAFPFLDGTSGGGTTPNLIFSAGEDEPHLGRDHQNMVQTELAGPLRRPNPAGDRTPLNSFAPSTHEAKIYITWCPPSSNTGMDYKSPFAPSTAPVSQQLVNNTVGVGYGYNPFYSIISGSGAVRASDGRYYINATSYGAATNDTDRLASLAGDPSGFYLNGSYSKNNGTSRDASWTVKLDRQILEIEEFTEVYNGFFGSVEVAYHRSPIVNAFNRFVFGADSPKLTEMGEDIFGFDNVQPEPEEEDDITTPPATNVMAYTRVSTDAGRQVANADEARSELRFVAGENITIEVADGDPDTVTITATDDAAITEVTNILDGTDIIDVSGASSSNNITVPDGDVAWISETELWYNDTGADVIVNEVPGVFIFGKIDTSEFIVVGDVRDVVAGSTFAETVTHLSVEDKEAVQVTDTVIRVNNTGATVDITVPTFFNTVPANWPTDGDGACMLRIGEEAISVNAVIDISRLTTPDGTGILVPDGSVGWVSATEQWANTTGQNQVIIDASPGSFDSRNAAEPDTPWLRLGDGNDDVDLSHTDIEPAPADATIDRTITISDHGLNGNNFSVQTYEEIGAAMSDDWSLFLPDTLIIRSTGNIEITIPANTVSGRVKTEIRA